MPSESPKLPLKIILLGVGIGLVALVGTLVVISHMGQESREPKPHVMDETEQKLRDATPVATSEPVVPAPDMSPTSETPPMETTALPDDPPMEIPETTPPVAPETAPRAYDPAPFPQMAERPALPERGKRTEAGVLQLLGPVLEPVWRTIFEEKGVKYPPAEVTLVAFKEDWTLHLYARDKADPRANAAPRDWVHLRAYPVLGASGVRGPKLREGDYQVPEGIYNLEYLNPNSAYHLSMKLNYPNKLDRAHAQEEGRTTPGGDIMIHGDELSIGCLAMGDPAAEELFVLVARAGLRKVSVMVAPRDFRLEAPSEYDLTPPQEDRPIPAWTSELYADLSEKLAEFPAPDQ